jgi:hypothetical protein
MLGGLILQLRRHRARQQFAAGFTGRRPDGLQGEALSSLRKSLQDAL